MYFISIWPLFKQSLRANACLESLLIRKLHKVSFNPTEGSRGHTQEPDIQSYLLFILELAIYRNQPLFSLWHGTITYLARLIDRTLSWHLKLLWFCSNLLKCPNNSHQLTCTHDAWALDRPKLNETQPWGKTQLQLLLKIIYLTAAVESHLARCSTASTMLQPSLALVSQNRVLYVCWKKKIINQYHF